MNCPTGHIIPADRSASQNAAHARNVSRMVHHALVPPKLAKGEKVDLTAAWNHPDVVADVGFAFNRFHQLTGSCVGAGGGNGLFSTIAVQRLASSNPTKAFLPFWLAAYAVSRHLMGDDSQGEGSLGSSFAEALRTGGIRDWVSGKEGMPTYNRNDGIMVDADHVEMIWSSYRNSSLAGVLDVSKAHLLGSATPARTPDDIAALIANGYGVGFACNNYIGNGSIRGSGANARVMGRWDGRGGHQQSVHGVEEHPDFGRIFLVLNNWPGSTYPVLPTQPVCSTWVAESDVEAALRLDSEVYGYSHLPWFPAQPNVPEILNWSEIGA